MGARFPTGIAFLSLPFAGGCDMPPVEQRSTIDRRRRPRGGRRSADTGGLTPLVLVVGGATSAADASEAVLAKLRFGVATAETADEAVRLLPTLRPDVVVVPAEDVLRLRQEAPTEELRVIAMRNDPELLIEAIRRTLA
jgi:hypothetical protein